MNLIVDIGNTRAKFVVFDAGTPIAQREAPNDTLEGLADYARRFPIERTIVSSVAKATEESEAEIAKLSCKVVRLDSATPLPVDITFPPAMGADRIAAIVYAMYSHPATPLLVVDAGTCITYEMIDSHGRYVGGNISPGVRLRFQAMHDHTALLPLVDSQGDTPLAGYDTDTAMRSGVMLGVKHEIEGYIRTLLGQAPDLQVYITGGDHIELDNAFTNIIHADKYLVPRGLNCILDHNAK